jgi:hypothetical protein
MTTANKILLALLGLVLVVAGFAFYLVRSAQPTSAPLSGAVNPVNDLHQLVTWFTQTVYFGSSQQTSIDSSGKLTVGANGNALTQAQFGTCNPSTGSSSFAATTTQQFYCPVTGVQAGDLVIADLPQGAGANGSGPGSPYGGFALIAAYATTSNQIGMTYANYTGAATSSYSQATTTVEYRIIR